MCWCVLSTYSRIWCIEDLEYIFYRCGGKVKRKEVREGERGAWFWGRRVGNNLVTKQQQQQRQILTFIAALQSTGLALLRLLTYRNCETINVWLFEACKFVVICFSAIDS